jgi:hypothetical protein
LKELSWQALQLDKERPNGWRRVFPTKQALDFVFDGLDFTFASNVPQNLLLVSTPLSLDWLCSLPDEH